MYGPSAQKKTTTKMARVERWPLRKRWTLVLRFDSISHDTTVPQFFLEFGELKIATNCTAIKHSYTDWNQWGNTTEYWRLLCLPRQICRFSKIAAQSQAISLHELCQQNFLFSVIFKRVRSRTHHRKKKLRGWLVYIAHQHRTPNEWSKKLCKLVSGHKLFSKNSAGYKFLLGR